jgi:hypothetical protein
MKIIWNPLAKESYANILRFLTENYPLEISFDLDDRVEKLLERLTHFKFLCPSSQTHPLLRRCVINRWISMVYQVEGDEIWIYNFHNNRLPNSFN